jgi:hypothetical protein
MSRYTGRRQYLRSRGHATYRLVRYADDLVIMVKGTEQQAQALLQQLAGRVEAIGLKLKAAKTGVTHIDAGLVFLGQRIIRKPKGPICPEPRASGVASGALKDAWRLRVSSLPPLTPQPPVGGRRSRGHQAPRPR